METEEIKKIWAQYDKKLSENTRFNEQLLRDMKLEQSKNEMKTPLINEFFNLSVYFVATLYLVMSTIKYSNEIKFLIPGILASIFSLLLFGFSIHRFKLMTEIEYYNTPVLELQRSILRFKEKFLLYKKIEFIIFPLSLIPLWIILFKAVRNIDIYTNILPSLIISAILGLILGYICMIWIYKHWYEKKIKNTMNFLEDIKKFEEKE